MTAEEQAAHTARQILAKRYGDSCEEWEAKEWMQELLHGRFCPKEESSRTKRSWDCECKRDIAYTIQSCDQCAAVDDTDCFCPFASDEQQLAALFRSMAVAIGGEL